MLFHKVMSLSRCLLRHLRHGITGSLVFGCAFSAAATDLDGTAAGWPASITVTLGELEVRFESRSFWTLYRVGFRGERIGLDTWGSHYGSVVKLPGIGFIGSGHTENADEELLHVSLVVDGTPVTVPAEAITCTSIRLTKRSRIRTILLETTVDVTEQQIEERVQLRATAPTPVDLVYHFMHPWTPEMTHYLGNLEDGSLISGIFDDDKRQEIDKPTRWSAVFDEKTRFGVVTAVLENNAPAFRTRYWDVPTRYRKHYFTTFLNATIPERVTFTSHVVTQPFKAETEDWANIAIRIGEALCGEPISNTTTAAPASQEN